MSKSFRNIRMQEAKDPGEYDQEGDMSMTQLRSIIYHAQELHDQLDKNDNLPEWVQSKITLAQDYVQTACDYMYSQKNEEVVQEKRGLWDNIHAKRQRIKNGSGESMRKPGSEGAPSAEDLKNSQVKEESQIYENKITHIVSKVSLPKHIRWMDSEGYDTTTKALPKEHSKHKTHVGIVSGNSVESGYHEDGMAVPIKEEVKGEYERKVDTYLKKKYGKDISKKKLPQGSDFAAARRKERLASNGRMDEAPLRAVSALVGYPKLNRKIASKGTPGSEDERNKAAAGLRNDRMGLGRRAYTGNQHYDVRREEVEQMDEAGIAIFTKKYKLQRAERKKKEKDKEELDRKIANGTAHIQQKYKEKGVAEEVEQMDEGRPSQQHPIEGHEYHKKSDAELRYILKDAGTAAKAMKDHSPRAESKYLDQVNDASTVLSFRQRNGTPAWYKKKYDHVKEEVVTEGYFSDMDADNKDKQYAGTKAYHANKNAKKEMDPPFTPDAPKKNLGIVVGKRPEGMSKARHLARLAMKGELNKKKTVKEDSAPDVEKTNTPAKRTVSKTTMIVKDAAKSSKDKKNKDKFEAEPELSSQIVRNNF